MLGVLLAVLEHELLLRRQREEERDRRRELLAAARARVLQLDVAVVAAADAAANCLPKLNFPRYPCPGTTRGRAIFQSQY